MAQRLDPPLTRQRVAMLAREPDFPPPAATIAGRRVWRWGDVQPWLEQRLQRRGRVIRLEGAAGRALDRIAAVRGLSRAETVAALIHEEEQRMAAAKG